MGQELLGKPSWKRTIILRAKNSQLFASKTVEFSLRTLPNFLLTRFHAKLLQNIKAFLEKLGEESFRLVGVWKAYRMYHEEFINSSLWSAFLEEGLREDFESLGSLDRVRRMAKGEMLEIIDLWEAYITERSFLTDFGHRFDTALKPLSKIYELWCFKKLCDILGVDRKSIKKFPCRINLRSLGGRKKLYYNTVKGLKKYSGIMKKMGVSLGRPDFVLESNRRRACIMDAKCKPKLNTDDAHRILSYLLDYMYPNQESMLALIFYLSKKTEIREIEVKKCKVHLIPLTPTSYSNIKEKIKEIINETL